MGELPCIAIARITYAILIISSLRFVPITTSVGYHLSVFECKYNNKIWKNDFLFVFLHKIIKGTTFLEAWT